MDLHLHEETGAFVAKSELDAATCERIIKLADGKWRASKVEGTSGDEGTDSNLRISEICFIKDQWVLDIIWPYMIAYNEVSGLNFDIRTVEDLQLTRYSPGGFYDFHIDGFSSKRFSVKGNCRKISMSVQLNEDYEGGEFQIARCRLGKLEKDTLSKSLGSIILFPSTLEHRVAPITSGIRFSLVAWFLGPPLR